MLIFRETLFLHRRSWLPQLVFVFGVYLYFTYLANINKNFCPVVGGYQGSYFWLLHEAPVGAISLPGIVTGTTPLYFGFYTLYSRTSEMTAKIYFIFYSSGFFVYLQYLLYFMLCALESICILGRMKVRFAFVREMTPDHDRHAALEFTSSPRLFVSTGLPQCYGKRKTSLTQLFVPFCFGHTTSSMQWPCGTKKYKKKHFNVYNVHCT